MTHGVLKAFSGYIRDNALLVESSSGGFAYAFSLKWIESGGVVYSVRYSPDFRIGEWCKASKVEDLSDFRGSKYVESRKVYEGFDLYSSVKGDLEGGLDVLVIGLPCDMGALKSFLKKDYPNLWCVDLVCHGPTEKRIAVQFLDVLERKYGSKVVEFSVRYKKGGKWTPPYLRAVFENGKIFMKPFYETDYGIAFSIMSRRACYNCKFKGSNHRSDITVGDYWGLAKDNKREWNGSGVSIGFVRSPKGQMLIDSIRDICVVNDTDMGFAMAHNALLNRQKQKSALYDKFVSDLNHYGLRYAVVHRYPIHRKLVVFVRRVMSKACPESVKHVLRRLICRSSCLLLVL